MTAKTSEPVVGSKASSRWSQDRRLEFIDFRLRWDGRINRSDITAYFGISVPQASLDIAKYLELSPGNLEYDRSSRIYLAAKSFKPLFASSNTDRYLSELLAQEAGFLESEASFMGWMPPTALVLNPARQINAQTLMTLLQAIRNKTSVRVLYQSMSKPEPGNRILTPHAFAHDGYRWHLRAYCHQREQFLDFVVARILEVEPSPEPGPIAVEDKSWQQTVEVVIAPHPKLSESSKRAIGLDYGMDAGEVRIICRRALLFYFLKHLGLDSETEGEPPKQQIVMCNRAEVLELLKDA